MERKLLCQGQGIFTSGNLISIPEMFPLRFFAQLSTRILRHRHTFWNISREWNFRRCPSYQINNSQYSKAGTAGGNGKIQNQSQSLDSDWLVLMVPSVQFLPFPRYTWRRRQMQPPEYCGFLFWGHSPMSKFSATVMTIHHLETLALKSESAIFFNLEFTENYSVFKFMVF